MTNKRVAHVLGLALLLVVAAPAALAERIVAVGGAVTETLYALGAGHRLVGVDSTSRYPTAAAKLPDVGYLRTLSAEPIIALRPDLILYDQNAGPPEAIAQLAAAQIKMVRIPDEPSIAGVVAKIRAVAAAVDLSAAGETLVTAVNADLATVARRLTATTAKPRVLFVLEFNEGAVLAAGRDTAADGIIALAGGENVAGAFSGYKPIGAESLLTSSSDFILTMERAVASFKTPTDVLALPALQMTPAARNKRLVVMDGLLLLGFGPRLGTATRLLADAIHSVN